MQNRKFFAMLAAAIALTAGLASCSNNDDELNPKKEGRIPITLTSNVGSRATDQSLQETMIADGVIVGGYINQGDIKLADLQLASNGEGGFTGQNLTTDDSSTPLNIYAYAPYKGGGITESSNTFTIEQNQSGDNATDGYIQSDLMIAKSEGVAPTSSPINLTFEHKMAKLDLNFDLTDANGVTLEDATVSVLQVESSVTVDLVGATVSTNLDNKIDITATSSVNITSETKASVVFPSQTMNSDDDFVKVVAGNKTYTAKLPSTVNFKSGMKYAYTVKFTTSEEGGEPGPGSTTIQLVPGKSTVNPWGDGTLDQYQVGDYVTSDGTIIPRAEAGSHAKKGDIVAVIFSKEVSETDKAANYNAYAMDLVAIDAVYDKPDNSNEPISGTSIEKYIEALSDLDGRTKTKTALEWYSNNSSAVTMPDNSIFKSCGSAPITGLSSSEWFVPSFGQMVQFLNNIGGAEITSDIEVDPYVTAASLYTKSDDAQFYADFASCAEDAGKDASTFIPNLTSSKVYVTVTESQVRSGGTPTGVNFWCFQANPGNVENSWAFGRNPGKGGTARKLLRCVAIQLPTASTPISATEAIE